MSLPYVTAAKAAQISKEVAKEEIGKIPAGTEVIANPELTGEEPSLTGLKVGEQTYQLSNPDAGKRVITYDEVIGEDFKTILEDFASDEHTIEDAPQETIINFKNCRIHQFNDILSQVEPEAWEILFISRVDDETGEIIPARIEEWNLKSVGWANTESGSIFGEASCVIYFDTGADTEEGISHLYIYWSLTPTPTDGPANVYEFNFNNSTRFSGHIRLKWRDVDAGGE